MSIVATVTGAWSAFATKVGAFLPDLFAALIILIVGWVLCNIGQRLVVRLLRTCQFDRLADRSGINRAMELGGIRQSSTEILGLLVFWFFFLFVVGLTFETVGLTGATETLNTIYLYVPKVVAAIVVLILGLYLASFLETVSRTSCANAGLRQADAIGRIVYYATVAFIVAAILQILEIASEIVMWAFVLVFGAVCLALALAFGLGGRDVATRLLTRWLEEEQKR